MALQKVTFDYKLLRKLNYKKLYAKILTCNKGSKRKIMEDQAYFVFCKSRASTVTVKIQAQFAKVL